jgi:predicted ATPase/DNA-binding winged helix-turn-helix (wHTH) protein
MAVNPSQIFEFGAFRLDLKDRLLTRGHKQIALTPKAFEVLVFLIERRGHLVEKDELMRKVWPDSFVEEGNLSRTIWMLRKAMGEGENGEEMIQTVPKYGYRFVSNVTEHCLTANGNGFHLAENVPPNNLSKTLPLLVGREKQIAEIRDLLSLTHSRLVTLTGVGGTGKTRLAQAVAEEVLEKFDDGVFLIELAGITKPALVQSSIAEALGITEIGGASILDVLKTYLREKRILLIIDSFEHVVGAASQVGELLSASKAVKVLVTSRIPLHLDGEVEFVVPPLSVPTEPHDLSIDELFEFEAVKLFVERARNSNARFALTEGNARSVAEICARLDGLPLAIELAAAWVKLLAPHAILEKLGNRLKLLTRRSSDLPTKQQTMRGAVDWSYNLLTHDERQVFQCLSVFAGGFSMEGAEAVITGAKSVTERENIDVLDVIRSLVEQSLLAAVEQPDGDIRFRMLEVVRDFAAETLVASGEGELLRRRHAEYFLAFSENAEPEIYGGKQLQWVTKLEREHDNIRAALGWSLEHDPEIELRLAAAIFYFWLFRGHYVEGLGWLKSALEKIGDAMSSELAKAYHGAGRISFRLGDYVSARDYWTAGLRVGRIVNDQKQVAQAGLGLGHLCLTECDYEAARSLMSESLAIGKVIDDKSVHIKALSSLGMLAYLQEDYQTWQEFSEEAARLSRETGDRASLAISLNNIFEAHYQAGQYALANDCAREALVIARELNYKYAIRGCLVNFASLAIKQGQMARAAQLAGAAEKLLEALGETLTFGEAQSDRANLSELYQALNETAIAAAFERGHKLRLEDACALALENIAEESAA